MSSEAPDIPDGFELVTRGGPFGHRNGPYFEMTEADGTTVRGFRIARQHANLAGIAHGGMLMTFADMVLGQVARAAAEGPAVTVRLVTDFVMPARIGAWVEGRAALVRRTRELIFVRGRLTAGRHVIMSADGLFQPIRPRP